MSALACMEIGVAWFAQRNPVRYVEAEMWRVGPALNVVRVKSALVVIATLLTGVLVAPSDGLHPPQIFASASLLLRDSALPIPVAFAGTFGILGPSPATDSSFNVLAGLLAPAKRWTWYAGLFSSHALKVFSSEFGYQIAQMVLVDEPARLPLNAAFSSAGVFSDGCKTAAAAFAKHTLFYNEGRAA